MSEQKTFAASRLFGLESFKHQNYAFTMPVAHDLSLLKKADYFAMVTRGVSVGDTIRVRKEDNSYVGEYLVRSVKHNIGMKLALLWERDFSESKAETTGNKSKAADNQKVDFEVKWGGNAHKWRIVKISTNEVIEKDFSSEEDAKEALKNYL